MHARCLEPRTSARPLPPQPWIEGISQTIAKEVEGHYGDEDEIARRQDPGVLVKHFQVLSRRQHVPPARRRLPNSQAEEAQSRLAQYVAWHTERRGDNGVRKRVGQDVP